MHSHFLLFIIISLYLNIYHVLSQELLENTRCNHWPDRGTCERNFEVKWYYDRYDHRCRRFFYGGCDGNENRFDSLEECSSQCHYEQPSNRERCFQPHDPGSCNADIERWFFDMHKKQCVCSYWTGCSSNNNLYYSYNHCMLICGEYAEIKEPGIDYNYWGKLNGSIMSSESQRVFSNPPKGNYDKGIYSVSVPADDVQIGPHHNDEQHPSHNQKYDDALQAADYGDERDMNLEMQGMNKKRAITQIFISHADDIERKRRLLQRQQLELQRRAHQQQRSPSQPMNMTPDISVNEFDQFTDALPQGAQGNKPIVRTLLQNGPAEAREAPLEIIHHPSYYEYNTQNSYPAPNSKAMGDKIHFPQTRQPMVSVNTENLSHNYHMNSEIRHLPSPTMMPSTMRKRIKMIQKTKVPPRNPFERDRERQAQVQMAGYKQKIAQYDDEVRKRVQEQQQQVAKQYAQTLPARIKISPNQTPSHALLEEYKHHFEEHRAKLRRQLEAQFPNHRINLVPEIEAFTKPDGNQVVRQRIQWTATPMDLVHHQQQQVSQQPVHQQMQPTHQHQLSPQQSQPEQIYMTTLSPPQQEQQKQRELAMQNYMKHRSMPTAPPRSRRPELITTVNPPLAPTPFVHLPVQTTQFPFNQAYQYTRPAMPTLAIPRRSTQQQQKNRYPHYYHHHQPAIPLSTTTQQTITQPSVVAQSHYQERPVVTRPPAPAIIPATPVYQTTHKPQSQLTTMKTQAEPIEFYRPLVEQLTTEAALSLEEIIAMDDKNDDVNYDEYDSVMDELPDYGNTKKQSQNVPQPTRPITPVQQNPHNQNTRSDMSPIVFPTTTIVPRKRLFSPDDSDEYSQDIEFGWKVKK